MEKSAKIKDYILTSIRQQRWKQGEKLPSEAELCRELNVSITTLRIAMKTLSNSGVIERRRGAGSFVSKDLQVNKIIIFVNFESLSLSSGYIYRALVTRLKELISDMGFKPVLGIASGSTREEFFSNIQFERRDDINEIVGAISLLTCPPKMRRLMHRLNIPLLEMSCTGYNGEAREADGNHVYLDNSDLIYRGVEAFDRAGIRNFAIFYIQPNSSAFTGGDKFFTDLLNERGMAADEKHLIRLPWSWDRHEAYEAFLRWWQMADRPNAVFFTEDNICKEVMPAIWKLGIRIPEDLSVVTHSNSEIFHSPTALTMVEFDPGKISGILFQALRQLQRGENPDFPLLIEPELIAGRSLAVRGGTGSTAPDSRIEVIERLVYRDKAQRSGFGCWKSETGYCFVTGAEMFEVNSDIAGNDRYDCFSERFSSDHGDTWSASREVFSSIVNGDNIHRYCELFQNLDLNSNSIYRLYLEGTYENDSDNRNGIESFRRNFRLWARRSFDGGRSFSEPEDLTRIYHDIMPDGGKPLVSCSHLFPLSDGSIIIPVSTELAPLGETSVRMLHGRSIRGGGSTRTAWSTGEAVPFFCKASGLQLTEGSVAELPDGRVAALYRADPLAGGSTRWIKFLAVSEDGGHSFSPAQPWCYTDGTEVCSPSSMPRLWLHSSGRLFFIGNIWPRQVELMRSRNALSIVEIDRDTLRALPETVTQIDGWHEGDHPYLALSNFTVTEDRRTNDILVYCPKAYAAKYELADSVLMRYRIRINSK